MTDNDTQQGRPISEQEIANMRHNVNLLKSQIAAGRVDGNFLTRQVDKLADMMARLEAEQKRRRQESRFEALYNVTRLLGSSLDLQTVLDQVMDAIIQLTGAERGFLMLRDDDGELRVAAARNFDQQTLEGDKQRYSRTIVNQVMDDGKPVLTTNAAEDPRFAGQASIVGQALRSIMATPLRARNTVFGVAYVENRAIAGLFDENDLAALDTFAGQAAVAVDNARLFSVTDQQLSARVEELTQLRRIDLQLNATLDASKAMQITLEWACRISAADRAALGLFEGDPPTVRTVSVYPPGETLDIPNDAALQVAATGSALTGTRDERAAVLVPVRREQKVIGVVMLQRSGAFNAEQQEQIERVIGRAAVAIENARLYAAVQAADRAKSEFVGIVAHDLKVPMTSILGYAELTMMGATNLEERQVQFLGKIRDTVRRMEMLVSDLADISRIESGHFYMNVTQVKIADVVQAVKDNTLTQIQARSHSFIEEVEPNLPEIKTDYYRLLQVLTNLVSNAYKYTPDGGTITLRARLAGTCVEFSVTDTGIGLSKDAIAKLGTKFWRADDDYTRSQPGTGLGFSITRSLVEQMGGAIVISSEIGRGSSFTFCIPLEKARA